MLGVNASPDIQVAPSSSSSGSAYKGRGADSAPVVSTAIASTANVSANKISPQSPSTPTPPAPTPIVNLTPSSTLSSSLDTAKSPSLAIVHSGNDVSGNQQVHDASAGNLATFSLNLGPLSISGVINAGTHTSVASESGSGLNLNADESPSGYSREPFDREKQQRFFDSQANVKEQSVERTT